MIFIRDKWIHAPGFPIVRIANIEEADCSTIKFFAIQSRFTYSSARNFYQSWWISFDIKFIFVNLIGEYRVGPAISLGLLNSTIRDFSVQIPCNTEWKIVGFIPNPGRFIFYRYEFNFNDLDIISKVLNYNINLLSASDRAGYISDIFALIETKRLKKSDSNLDWVKSTFNFLNYEKSLSVWGLVLDEFKLFLTNLRDDEATAWFSDLIGKIVRKMGWKARSRINPLSSLREKFFGAAVWLGEPSTVNLTANLFSRILNGEQNVVDDSLLSIVYTSAIRWDTSVNFQLLKESCSVNFSFDKLMGLVSSPTNGYSILMEFRALLNTQEQIMLCAHVLINNRNSAKIIWKFLKTTGIIHGEITLHTKWAWITEVSLLLIDRKLSVK